MIATLRLVLALSALLVVCFDEGLLPSQFAGVAYTSLVAYGTYSLGLVAAALRGRPLAPARVQPCVDALFYGYLIALTGGPGSPFFYFYFFAIVAASMSRGFPGGLGVTLLCVALFTGMALAPAPEGREVDFHQALSRALNLLVLGGVIAWAGGRELAVRRRAALLGELDRIAHLSLTAADFLVEKLRLLAASFAADAVVLVCRNADSDEYAMYRVSASGKPDAHHQPTLMAQSTAGALLELPKARSVAWNARRPHFHGTGEQCGRLSNLLEAAHFATAPYRRQQQIEGRVYLISARQAFTRSKVRLLCQAADQIGTVVDRYVMMKDDAARAERSRISRDIHDTAIQPYIGLKLGIEALHRKLDPASPAARRVKELLELSSISVEELRSYVAQLRSSEAARPGEALPERLQAQAARYRDFWGIEVELRVARNLQVSDRVAAEAYQLACEALANIWRHTRATRAFVDLHCRDAFLVLEVGNERCGDSPAQPFMPRSIFERASALGGEVHVRMNNDGHDVVRVSVPMRAGL